MPSLNPMDLTGRRVLITGATSGIGRATAVFLSRLGARLVLSGRNQEKLETTLGSLEGEQHSVSPFELGQVEGIATWMQQLATEGKFHGVVHVAGKQVTAPLRMLSHAVVEDLIRTNLTAAIAVSREFTRKTFRAPQASLVLVSSIMGLTSRPGISAYSATKAALSGMTRSLALELAPEQVRVNCVAPAFVRTDMLDSLQASLTEEQFAALEQEHPLGFGTPEDVASAIAFLLADTGRWVTGTTLVIDGGYSAR